LLYEGSEVVEEENKRKGGGAGVALRSDIAVGPRGDFAFERLEGGKGFIPSGLVFTELVPGTLKSIPCTKNPGICVDVHPTFICVCFLVAHRIFHAPDLRGTDEKT